MNIQKATQIVVQPYRYFNIIEIQYILSNQLLYNMSHISHLPYYTLNIVQCLDLKLEMNQVNLQTFKSSIMVVKSNSYHLSFCISTLGILLTMSLIRPKELKVAEVKKGQ